MSLLSIADAVVEFASPGGAVRALDGVSLTMEPGETVAIVGESGCGKTTLARVILGLQALTSGSGEVRGRPMTKVHRGQAAEVGMVWQDPYASLDPRWSIRRLVEEPAKLAGRPVDVGALLTEAGLGPAFADRYPHQLSGGQRQRVAIARALALRPPLVICDEPTAALDLSVKAQILNLLKDLQSRSDSAFLFISHDLGTVRFLADRIVVMYLGRIVEEGRPEDVFGAPIHPYTKMLVDSTPSLEKLGWLPETAQCEPPDPRTRWVGCRYLGRCPSSTELCGSIEPPIVGSAHRWAACHAPLGSAMTSG